MLPSGSLREHLIVPILPAFEASFFAGRRPGGKGASKTDSPPTEDGVPPCTPYMYLYVITTRLRSDYMPQIVIVLRLTANPDLCSLSPMRAHHIPPIFQIPRGYNRTFIFSDDLTGFREEILMDDAGIHISTKGHAGPRTASLCLDWIAESNTQVREELGV